MNGITTDFDNDPDDISPIFMVRVYPGDPYEYTDAEMWAYGFMQGIELCRKDWQPFFDNPNSKKVMSPVHLLGSDDATPQELALTQTPQQRDQLAQQIPESLAAIYRFWLPYRQAIMERTSATALQRKDAKVGRNDPCPCGSQKKFKKCCGAATTLH